jgi:hypothetical protein
MSYLRFKRGRQINNVERKELNIKKRITESFKQEDLRLLFICKCCHLTYNRQIGKIVYWFIYRTCQEACLGTLKMAVISGSPLIILNTEREITSLSEKLAFVVDVRLVNFQQNVVFLLPIGQIPHCRNHIWSKRTSLNPTIWLCSEYNCHRVLVSSTYNRTILLLVAKKTIKQKLFLM